MQPVVSLCVLAAVIIVSVFTKKNVGILGMLAAYVYGVFVMGMRPRDIYIAGFPTSVIFVIIAATLFFGIANTNGTTVTLTKNILYFSGGRVKLLPWLFGLVGAILAGLGGGAFVLLIVLPIAMGVAVLCKMNLILVAVMIMNMVMCGGISPLAVNGIVGNDLCLKVGLTGYNTMWAAYAAALFSFTVLLYIIFKGWKSDATVDRGEMTPFDRNQKLTLIAIPVLCIAVVGFKQDVSLVAIALSAILLLLKAGDQKKAIMSVPWQTLFLIFGMSMLINVVVKAGGIKYLTDTLSAIITPGNSMSIMMILGSLMGAVSSGTGVVMPTLIPLAGELAAAHSDLNLVVMVTGVIIGTNGVVISPLSTVGAMCMGCMPEQVDSNKMYFLLLCAAIAFMLLAPIAAALGLFSVFC